jgi:flavin-dependent dehydrogenase
MTKKYDVVIVGAGPAGLMAAKTAGENGLSVALLERKTDIPKVHRADGGAIGVNEYLFEHMVIFNAKAKLFCFPVDGFTVPYSGPYSNIYGFQVYSPGKKRLLFGDWEEAKKRGDEVRVGVSISKDQLLKGLLDECRKHEVEVFPGINVTDVKKKGRKVEVIGDGRTFTGTFVIAADGVNSRIARILGFNKERKFMGTYRYLSWMMEGEIPVDPGCFNFVLTEKSTYAVLDTYEKGIYHIDAFDSNTKVDLNASLEEFMKDRTYGSWFAGCRKVGEVNCVSNIMSPLKDPFKDNILLIGDAAWTMEFSNMAALLCGWKAGNAIALAFVDKKLNRRGISSYLHWWEKEFYNPYGSYEFGPAGGGGGILQSLLSGEEIDYLVSLIQEPFPATMNFFTLFNTIGRAYAELFPRIQEERPEVMDKLFAMREKLEEIGEDIRKAGFPNR